MGEGEGRRGGKEEKERERGYTAARIRNCVSIEFTGDEVIKRRFLPPEMRFRSSRRALAIARIRSFPVLEIGGVALRCEKFRMCRVFEPLRAPIRQYLLTFDFFFFLNRIDSKLFTLIKRVE